MPFLLVPGFWFVVGLVVFFFFLATDKTATKELSTALHFCNMPAVLKLEFPEAGAQHCCTSVAVQHGPGPQDGKPLASSPSSLPGRAVPWLWHYTLSMKQGKKPHSYVFMISVVFSENLMLIKVGRNIFVMPFNLSLRTCSWMKTALLVLLLAIIAEVSLCA